MIISQLEWAATAVSPIQLITIPGASVLQSLTLVAEASSRRVWCGSGDAVGIMYDSSNTSSNKFDSRKHSWSVTKYAVLHTRVYR